MSVLQFAALKYCPLPTARFAVRSYTSTAQRYTLYVHDHEKLDVYCAEIVYEYKNDCAITQAKPEQALRDPRLGNHQLQRRARRSSPYLDQQAGT
jgi:hypothetical protein